MSTTFVSAGAIAEAQTRALEREFASSRPRPRNKAMGFRGKDTRPPRRQRPTSQLPLSSWMFETK